MGLMLDLVGTNLTLLFAFVMTLCPPITGSMVRIMS